MNPFSHRASTPTPNRAVLETALRSSAETLFVCALIKLGAAVPNNWTEDSLAEGLRAHGVDEDDIQIWEHAERVFLNALDLDPHGTLYSQGGETERLYLLMWAMMKLIADGSVEATAAGLRHVLKLGVDAARDTYAFWSLGEKEEGDSSSESPSVVGRDGFEPSSCSDP